VPSRNSVDVLDFSRDGWRLASAGYDAIILVWDVTGQVTARPEAEQPLTQRELERLWTDLADEKNASQAYASMRVKRQLFFPPTTPTPTATPAGSSTSPPTYGRSSVACAWTR
jgi:hypothetical protein